MPLPVLILGGTTEAAELGRALAGDARFRATISLAGRTRRPAPQALPVRMGGFGGVAGLIDHLRGENIAALIDATHPFAAQMTAHAVAAAAATGTALLLVRRPEWRPGAGDVWRMVDSMAEAAGALGKLPRRVLLTVGQKDLAPFAAVPWHDYLIRSIEPPAGDAPAHRFLAARGPFTEAEELALLRRERIDAIVTKNSGGVATEAKLAAARALGVSVVMVARPPLPEGAACVATVSDADAALAWLHARSPRGV